MKTTESKSIQEEQSQEEIEQLGDAQKREFIKKFGRYAASAPVGAFILMTPSSSKAQNGSDTGP